MKKMLFLLLLLFVSLILPAREMILPMALAPLQGDLLHMSIWDFSQQWIAGDKAKTTICVYGDSLLAETYDGRRFWYDISGDSLLYNGEEDRLTSICLDKPVYISSVPLSHGANNGSPVFSACGKGGGRQFSVSEFGSLEFTSSAQPGVLILAPGDTVSNVLAVRELRDITAYPTDDSLATTHLIAETYRWYDSNGLVSLLPLAVQRSVYIGASVTLDSSQASSVAYLPERNAFKSGRQDDDGDNGRKTKIDYAQGPETIFGGDLPAEQDYVITSSRVYAGPHIFADGQLEYSAFDGGYFNAAGSPCYYITDWQGNNAAVVDSEGTKIQSAAYYPYGEPTVEPKGQRFLFGGKEREHAGGRNAYDFGARSLTPYGSWPSPDPKAEDFYQISPFSYCAGDPINRIDENGKEWTVTEVENDNEQIIELRITGVLINLSSNKHDLNALSIAISKQLESIFTVQGGGVNSIMKADIRAISALDEISQSDHVIAIVDLVDSEIDALASIDKLCGLRIKIGNEIATETISRDNSRTVAHEIGHSGGLKHTKKKHIRIPI